MGTHHQERQAKQLAHGETQMGASLFHDKQKDYCLQTDSFVCFKKTKISDELPDGSQKMGSYWTKTEETCMWHERCLPTLVGTFLTRHCLAMALVPHEPIDEVTCYVLHLSPKQSWEHWIQGSVALQSGTKRRLVESRERPEMEAAFEENAWSVVGRPATGKSVARIINIFVDDFFD